MRITAFVRTKNSIFYKHKDAVNFDVQNNIFSELIKNEAFIDIPTKSDGIITEVRKYLFVLTANDLDKLKDLSKQYPELKDIINEIVIEK